MKRTLFRQASAIVTMDSTRRVLKDADMLVVGHRIDKVDADLSQEEFSTEEVDLSQIDENSTEDEDFFQEDEENDF